MRAEGGVRVLNCWRQWRSVRACDGTGDSGAQGSSHMELAARFQLLAEVRGPSICLEHSVLHGENPKRRRG